MEIKLNLEVSLSKETQSFLTNLMSSVISGSIDAPSEPKLVTQKEIKDQNQKYQKKKNDEEVKAEQNGKETATASSVTLETIKELSNKKSQEGKRDQIKELIKSFNSDMLKNLDPKHYPEFYEKLEAL